MINSLDAYRDCGRKVASALNRNDYGLSAHWMDWMDRAKALETDSDRKLALRAYHEGYAENRRLPR